ncbi:RES domain-containing protein, partial [Massilia antarctica]
MTTAAEDCPTPPPDVRNRPLPVIVVDLTARPLYRIHRNVRGPVYFNRPSISKTRFRFDVPVHLPPHEEFGVLYGGFSLSSCVFETIVRDRFRGVAAPLLIEAQEFDDRSISRVVAEPA